MHKLFIYGSLKRGFKQHDRHMQTAHFIDEVETAQAAYTLVAVLDPDSDTPFPGLVEGGETRIKGELYEIGENALARLDEYEGDDYSLVEVALNNGQTALAYAYTGQDIPVTPAHPYIRATGDLREWVVK